MKVNGSHGCRWDILNVKVVDGRQNKKHLLFNLVFVQYPHPPQVGVIVHRAAACPDSGN